MRQIIDSRTRKLDSFFRRTSEAGLQEEMQTDLARLGAVLICGYVEQCVAVVIIERLKTRAQPRVLNFVKSHFRRGTNYNCKAIMELLDRFDPDWSRRFKEFCLVNESHVVMLDSAYFLRNSIVHGGDASRGMTGVKELYDSAQNVIDALIDATG